MLATPESQRGYSQALQVQASEPRNPALVRGNGNIPWTSVPPFVGYPMRTGVDFGASGSRIVLALAFAAMMSFLPLHNAAASVDEGPFDGVQVVVAPYAANPSVHEDGTITAGEYDQNDSYKTADTGISVMLTHDNSSLYVGMTGPAWGWLALGISSDMEAGMGFVVVGSVGGTYVAEERFSADVSDSIAFSSVHGPGDKAIEEFGWMQHEANVVAEMKLSMDSQIWNLTTGQVFATVIASNATVGYSLPGSASGDQIHYLGSYLLRPQDSQETVKLLFSGEVSPVPGYVALALMALGTIWILYEFVFRRGRR